MPFALQCALLLFHCAAFMVPTGRQNHYCGSCCFPFYCYRWMVVVSIPFRLVIGWWCGITYYPLPPTTHLPHPCLPFLRAAAAAHHGAHGATWYFNVAACTILYLRRALPHRAWHAGVCVRAALPWRRRLRGYPSPYPTFTIRCVLPPPPVFGSLSQHLPARRAHHAPLFRLRAPFAPSRSTARIDTVATRAALRVRYTRHQHFLAL